MVKRITTLMFDVTVEIPKTTILLTAMTAINSVFLGNLQCVGYVYLSLISTFLFFKPVATAQEAH